MLIERVNRETTAGMDVETFTIGFARRATQYKRLDLVFRNRERLRRISGKSGGLQLVLAGKAHPRDFGGKELIRRVFQAARDLAPEVRIAYLADYDLDLARMIVAGVDLWLNTPQKPLEASGTSGMKAAHNGVPSLSVLDGWWLEGHIDGATGWTIGSPSAASEGDESEANDLYDKLEHVILPMYHRERDTWLGVMRGAIAFNASFFNTQRMVQQYALSAYLK